MSETEQNKLVRPLVNDIYRKMFEPPVVDRSIRYKDYTEIPDQDGDANTAGKQNYVFNCLPSTKYHVIDEAYIEAVYRIEYKNDISEDLWEDGGGSTKEQKAAEAGWDKDDPRRLLKNDPAVGVANPMYLFREVDLTINGHSLERIEYPGVAFQVKNLMEMPSSLMDSYCDSIGFIPDTGLKPTANEGEYDYLVGEKYTFDNGEIKETEGYNDGYKKRKARYTLRPDGFVSVQIPLSAIFDFSSEVSLPLINVPIKISFRRDSKDSPAMILADPTKAIEPAAIDDKTYYDAGGGYRVRLETFKLWMQELDPSNSMAAVLYQAMLEGQENDLIYENTQIRELEHAPVGSSTYFKRIGQFREVITSVSLVFIDAGALSNTMDKKTVKLNPAHFHNLNVADLQFDISGTKVPNTMVEANFSPDGDLDLKEKQFMRLYHDFLNSSKNCVGKTCTESIISYKRFRDISTIFHADLKFTDKSMYDMSTEHPLSVKLKFRKALPKTMAVFALVGTERYVTIVKTKDRKTLVNFQQESS